MKLSEKGIRKIYDSLDESCERNEPEDISDIVFNSDDFKEFEKELTKFVYKLAKEQKPLPADMARLLNEHFWELG